MKNEKSGICLLINNEEFQISKDTRTGCIKDEERLKTLFEKLHFEVLEPKRNRSKREIFDIDFVDFIKRLEENETKYDAMVLIIMSHGKKDAIIDRENNEIKVIPFFK